MGRVRFDGALECRRLAMLDRDSCERRVYRLATLLTGNAVAATRVIETVVGAQPDLRRLDSAHIDRLTVLRSREVTRGALRGEGLPEKLLDGLALLNGQQREAWIFHYVYRMDLRDMARAMDCSVRAVEMHLLGAAGAMKPLVPDAAAAGKALLAWSMKLEVPPFYRAGIERRRRLRLVLWLLLVAGVVGAIVLAAGWISRSGGLDSILGWGEPPP